MTNKFFESPQTGSVYVKVTSGNELFVGVREINHNHYRITVRGDAHVLSALNLPGFSGIKDNDHRSIVVPGDLLDYYVGTAVTAINGHTELLPWKTALAEPASNVTIECDECGNLMHV